jgi:16S rRNA (adenine1518-N6/adenine1519-N6)-dimethyltransferase
VGHKEYSALTVILSAVFECIEGFIVGPKNFYPQPKVDSQVIKLVSKENPLPRAEMEGFKKLVFSAFSQRRKMLRNSLMGLPGISRDALPGIAAQAGISVEKRPQELSWEEYVRLNRVYRKHMTS